MIFGILLFSIFCLFDSKAKFEEYDDTYLPYLNYVDPQACDYPNNLDYFHTYKEFENLRYDLKLPKDSLYTTHSFYEFEYDEDKAYRIETIRVHFISTNDFRSIIFAEYKLQALK